MSYEMPNADFQFNVLRFTRILSGLIDSGVSLMRTLATVKAELPPPFDEMTARVMRRIEEGSTMTQALTDHPEFFSPLYLAMVRAGEVGGVLDETTAYLVELLEDEWTFSKQAGWDETNTLMLPSRGLPEDWAELSEYQRTFVLMLFSRSFGLMLTSGVPIFQAFDVAADFMPVNQRQKVKDDFRAGIMRREMGSAVLEQMGFLPPSFIRLFEVGETSGTLDFTMMKAGLLYRDQLRYSMGLVGDRTANRTIMLMSMEERMARGYIPSDVPDRLITVFIEKVTDTGITIDTAIPVDGRSKITRLAELILALAIRQGADGIEMQRVFGGSVPAQVKFRFGEELREVSGITIGLFDMLRYHFLSQAGLNPKERRQTEEGSFTFHFQDADYPVSVALRPGEHGPGVLVIQTGESGGY